MLRGGGAYLCLMNEHREHAPSIIFMDEIDSIGSARIDSSGGGGGDSEVQRTMLELLNQLDGFEPTQNIKVGLTQLLEARYFSSVTSTNPLVRYSCARTGSTFWTLHFCVPDV